MEQFARRGRGRLGTILLGSVVIGWAAALLVLSGTGADKSAQLVSNIGLTAIPLAAGAAGLRRARGAEAERAFWILLGLASLSWGAGMAVWAWYESVLGREVPFPSLADVGYLGLPPLAAAALLCLPVGGVDTLAGRVRTLLDGLIVAISLLLVSWVLVLAPVVEDGGTSIVTQAISLAYPVGDAVVITIVVYAWVRARAVSATPPVSLPLVGAGLVAFAVADSGFVVLTTTGAYSSGSYIDIGWFVGFTLLLRAATARPRERGGATTEEGVRWLGTLVPYSAVTVALLTTAVEVWQEGSSDEYISWGRAALIAFLVVRQILTLRENWLLARYLEQRVEDRTAELEFSRERFSALVQHSSDVVTVIDRAGRIRYQSQSCLRILQRPVESMTDRQVWDFVHADQAEALRRAIDTAAEESLRIQTVQTVWPRFDGTPCHLEVTITNLLDNPAVQGLVLNSRDVTDRTVLEEQLLHQAFHDSLTTLSNRAMFRNRLEHALTRRDLRPGTLAVLFLDIDGFKEVNDTMGHSSGDNLLVQVASRLHGAVRSNDTVARFGGDEFAILVENLADPAYTITLAERVNAVLQEPYQLDDSTVHVSASVGIAHYGDHAIDAEALLRNADLAMYQAKATTSGGYAMYDPIMHAGLVERVRLEGELRTALDTGGLAVHYQPLVNMQSGMVTGVEALCRWPHAELGNVPPSEFIPLAEATGLIPALGTWVLRTACRQVAQWRAECLVLTDLRVSVNVSARQLLDDDLVTTVSAVLDETGLPAQCLTLEMTESVLMDDAGPTLSALRAIRAMGVRLAIDDFGTGYSSLSYLHRFPVDVLKIDRTFIERLTDAGDAALVSTIVRLGHTMHLETVAEGIERPDEMLMLRRQGCTTGQGYFFARPMPADELQPLLVERTRANVLQGSRVLG